MTAVATDPPRLPRLHASTRSLLIVVAVGMALTITTRVLAGMGVLPADAVPTGLLVLVLVLGTVVMLGNVIITEAWTWMAERTGSHEVLRFAGQALQRADVVFTAPGIFLMVISGRFLVEQVGEGSTWVLATEVSFIAAGVVWILLLVPMQNRLAVRAQAGRIDRAFFRTLHRWYAAGITATLLTVLAVGFAVVQPAL